MSQKSKAAGVPSIETGPDSKMQKLDDDPDDQIPRKRINLGQLDLKSRRYVEEWKQFSQAVKRLEKGRDGLQVGQGRGHWKTKRCYQKGGAEPDLDPHDIDAQIERCKERVQENIFPHVFEVRLKDLEMIKALDELKNGEPENLRLEVYERIKTLEHIRLCFENEEEDKDEQLPNIKALLEAYRANNLQWLPGLVTYWSKGHPLCEPRPFDWDEFEAINSANNGSKGIWVEGLRGPGPINMYMASRVIPCLPTPPGRDPIPSFEYRIALRLPGHPSGWWDEFDFLWDTGADIMTIRESDLISLSGVAGWAPTIPLLFRAIYNTASGNTRSLQHVELEACILNANQRRMTAWVRLPVAISAPVPPETAPPQRLDGPILRSLLFTATQPHRRELIISTTKSMPLQTRNLLTHPPTMPDFQGSSALNHYLFGSGGDYRYSAAAGGGTGAPVPGNPAMAPPPPARDRGAPQ